MRHSIIIGADEEEVKLPCCHTCLWLNADISQSRVSYCLHNGIIPMTLYVLKNSDEGKHITDWIQNEKNQNNESVRKKALELMLPRLRTEEFISIIETSQHLSYEQGYKQAKADIRKALGVY